MTKDELEDQGLVEVCTNCGSMHLKEYNDRVVCTNCGTVDFVHQITEEELEYQFKLKNDLNE